MKWMHGSVRRERTFGFYILLAVLLFGPAILKADVVLDWNAIAVDTAIANGMNPVPNRGMQPSCNWLSLKLSTQSLETISRI